jgi:sterol 3beta-glucosyltransferase
VLYCGFGSAALRDGAAVAAACIAGGRAAGCRVLLAGGLGGGLPRPHNDDDADVMWLQDAPHDWLLPRCAVALHHGGAGTVHAALRAGTPQVIAPLQYDQPFWARRMRALGVAPAPLDVAALRSGDVAAAVRRALSEPIRSRAAAIRDELVSDADGAAVAAAFIAAYVPAALEKMKRLKAAADAPLQPCSADERAGETAARARTVAAGGCG